MMMMNLSRNRGACASDNNSEDARSIRVGMYDYKLGNLK